MIPVLLLGLSIAIRTAIVMIVLLIGLRLAGSRQIGQMNIYDLAFVMLLANSVQNAMTAGKGNLVVGFASAGTLLLIGILFTIVFVRLPQAERLVTGSPVVLVSQGQIHRATLRRQNLTVNQLEEAMREREISDVSTVKLAVLEVDGDISIVEYDKHEKRHGKHPPKP